MKLETPTCQLISQAQTHPGYVRTRNEDALLDMPEAGLWAVADGMGGHAGGALASRLVVGILAELGQACVGMPLVQRLGAVLQDANRELIERRAAFGGEIVGSTVVVLVLENDNYHCYWAGDSRLYLLRDGRLQQLTRDHVVCASEEGPRGALTRALGADVELELDYLSGPLYENDLFLLCSDGLTKVVENELIADSLGGQSVCDGARDLLEVALQRGGPDNISLVAVYVPPL